MKATFCFIVLLALLAFIPSCIDRVDDNSSIASTPSKVEITEPSSTKVSVVNIGDSGFLSDEPCGPPCFMGMEPGITTKAEALEILKTRGFLEGCVSLDAYQAYIARGEGGWSCQTAFSVRYPQNTEIINYIGINLNNAVTLQDIINKLGYPSFVLVLNTGLPEHPTVQISLYYSEPRIVIPLGGEFEGFQFEISQTTLIDSVDYLDLQTLEYHYELFSDELIAWKGYGIYP